MKTQTTYICDNCGKKFTDIFLAKQHEAKCTNRILSDFIGLSSLHYIDMIPNDRLCFILYDNSYNSYCNQRNNYWTEGVTVTKIHSNGTFNYSYPKASRLRPGIKTIFDLSCNIKRLYEIYPTLNEVEKEFVTHFTFNHIMTYEGHEFGKHIISILKGRLSKKGYVTNTYKYITDFGENLSFMKNYGWDNIEDYTKVILYFWKNEEISNQLLNILYKDLAVYGYNDYDNFFKDDDMKNIKIFTERLVEYLLTFNNEHFNKLLIK